MKKNIEDKIDATLTAAKSDLRKDRKVVEAKIHQGFENTINVRIVPGRDFPTNFEPLGCQPREGATRRDTETVPLPEELTSKLKDANKKVVAWLAKDKKNASFFLRQPVEALLKAGIDLSRSEQKALDRSHRQVREVSIVPPGVNVTELSAVAYPKGRVGEIKPGKDKPDDDGNNNGCGPKVKGE